MISQLSTHPPRMLSMHISSGTVLWTALILHLQHNTSIDVQTAFFGCWSQKWITFLEGSCPYFLIVGQWRSVLYSSLASHLISFDFLCTLCRASTQTRCFFHKAIFHLKDKLLEFLTFSVLHDLVSFSPVLWKLYVGLTERYRNDNNKIKMLSSPGQLLS